MVRGINVVDKTGKISKEMSELIAELYGVDAEAVASSGLCGLAPLRCGEGYGADSCRDEGVIASGEAVVE